MFGDARFTILYSGNFGEAHSYEAVLSLARRLGETATFAFSVRGNRVDQLKAAITPSDSNIRFVDFADEAQLSSRLASADLHLVTLREGWDGIVVPSKFFGALAIGRPVLFAGPENSAVARWIREHGVGLMVDEFTPDSALPDATHCWQVYQDHFSRSHQVAAWCDLVSER